jgi:hypothetical protein
MPGDDQTIETLQAQLAALEAARDHMAPPETAPRRVETASLPALAAPDADPYAVTSWGETGYDFRTPSGQLCRLRKLDPARLAMSGVLDKITRLPGLAQEQIDKAEGNPPPATPEMPSSDQLSALTDVLQILIPLAVEKPAIWELPAEGEERVNGRVYIDTVDFADQVAIMERVTGGVKAFDNFRQES